MKSSRGTSFQPILTVILSKQQQKALSTRKSNLDTQKYKNGKLLYLAYIQAVAESKESQRYQRFIQSFQQMGYVDKILKISSLKYYKDIRTLLFGAKTDQEIKNDKGTKVVQVSEVVKQLESISQQKTTVNRSKPSQMQNGTSGKQIPNLTQTKLKIERKNFYNAGQDDNTQTKYWQKNKFNSNQRKAAGFNQMDIELDKQIQKYKYLTPDKNKVEQQSPQSKSQLLHVKRKLSNRQKINKVIESRKSFENEIVDITKSEKATKSKPNQQEQEQQQPINPIQTSFIKLHRVEVGYKPGMLSDRPTVQQNKNKSSINENKSVRSFGKSTKLDHLQKNNLYERRQNWGSNYQKQKSQKTKQQSGSQLVKSNSFIGVATTKGLSSEKKPAKSNTRNNPSLLENICKKLFECLKGLNLAKTETKRIQIKQQEKVSLINKSNLNLVSKNLFPKSTSSYMAKISLNN